MTQTMGSGGTAALAAEDELATKTPAGAKAGTPPKKVTMETAEQTTPTEVPLTTEQKVANLEKRLEDAVAVINNLIAFCNTVERWRTLPFKTEEQLKADETTGDTKEVDETTSE